MILRPGQIIRFRGPRRHKYAQELQHELGVARTKLVLPEDDRSVELHVQERIELRAINPQ